MAHLTTKNVKVFQNYLNTEPRQLGDLHQRMQYLMSLLHGHGPHAIPLDVWHACFDLECEVQYYEPVHPPYGQRFRK